MCWAIEHLHSKYFQPHCNVQEYVIDCPANPRESWRFFRKMFGNTRKMFEWLMKGSQTFFGEFYEQAGWTRDFVWPMYRWKNPKSMILIFQTCNFSMKPSQNDSIEIWRNRYRWSHPPVNLTAALEPANYRRPAIIRTSRTCITRWFVLFFTDGYIVRGVHASQ